MRHNKSRHSLAKCVGGGRNKSKHRKKEQTGQFGSFHGELLVHLCTCIVPSCFTNTKHTWLFTSPTPGSRFGSRSRHKRAAPRIWDFMYILFLTIKPYFDELMFELTKSQGEQKRTTWEEADPQQSLSRCGTSTREYAQKNVGSQPQQLKRAPPSPESVMLS